nr:ATP-binding protein [Microbispora rosea]
MDDAGLQALREAARLSPDNFPLRRHLAEQLLAKGYLADAEAEFRAALLLSPKDPDVIAGLAEAFVRQSAYGAALSALEPLLAEADYLPRVGLLAARALLGEGDVAGAAHRYHDAISRDPSLSDPNLAARLAPQPAVPDPIQPHDGSTDPAQPHAGQPDSAQTYGSADPAAQPHGDSPSPAQPHGDSPDTAQTYSGSPDPVQPHNAQTSTGTVPQQPYSAPAQPATTPQYPVPAQPGQTHTGTPTQAQPYQSQPYQPQPSKTQAQPGTPYSPGPHSGTVPAYPAPAYPAPPYGTSPLAEDSDAEVERSRVTFADVAGMDAVKEALRVKLLLPLQQPELFAAYGKRAGGGVLLYGPPGAGKTHLARAAAGELGAAFINVGLADILDMYIGSSERNLRSTFEMARRNRPCVLFFDEVDALAARRSDMRQAHIRGLVNQFLAELDGVDENANEGVLVLAATNAPWYIDAAFRRPGRFDQLVFVPPPDAAARAAILRILCRDKPLAEMDFDAVARATEGFVGADLKGLVDRAVETKLQQSIAAGRPIPLSTPDLLAVAQAVRPTSAREWLSTARNYVLHANDSGAWDELMPWIDGKKGGKGKW